MSRQTVIAAALIAALSLAWPGGADAQPVPLAAQWQAFAQRLPPGSFVAVRLTDGSRFRGTVVSVTDSGLSVMPRTRIPAGLRTVPFEAVAEIEPQKRPMSAGRKVITGLAVGAGVYTSLVIALLATAID